MNDRDRQRNRNNRRSKRVILVAYEGENKTEKYYFESFNERDKNYIIKAVPGSETDPINLVKQTIKKSSQLGLSLKEDDMAFCIIDTDTNPQKNQQIKEAVELANTRNISVITTSPCIELWFLLHYEFTTAYMSNDDAMKRLCKHYKKYAKNVNMYPILKDKIKVACDNAKRLEKYQLDNDQVIKSVEANPHSDVYQIIEELEKIATN